MIVKQFQTGGDRNFGYLVADDESKLAAVIDPSYYPKLLWKFAQKNDYKSGENCGKIKDSGNRSGQDGAVAQSGLQPDGAGRTGRYC